MTTTTTTDENDDEKQNKYKTEKKNTLQKVSVPLTIYVYCIENL